MSVKNIFLWYLRGESTTAQRARRITKILLLLALFLILFNIVPIDEVIRAILSADPFYLLIGLALSFASTALTAVEMEPLTRNQGIRHNIWQILEINLAVKFYSQFTPTTLVGSGLRWYRLAQPGGKAAESLAALAFFRSLETFLTLTTGLAFWMLAGQVKSLGADLFWIVVIVLGIILSWIVVTRKSIPLYEWFKAHGGQFLERPLWRPLTRRMEKFLLAVSAYAHMPALDLLLAVFAGVASVMCGILSGTVLAQAVGIDIGFLEMGWIQAVVLFTTQLPFAVAGGLGIREVTLVALLATYGVGAELSLAFSFLLFVRGVIISLTGGITEGIQALRAARPKEAEPAPGNVKES